MTGLTVNDTIADADMAVTGKTVSDLQSGVKFGANAITGTLKYIENWTFLLDLKIILKTVTNMFGKEEGNAY